MHRAWLVICAFLSCVAGQASFAQGDAGASGMAVPTRPTITNQTPADAARQRAAEEKLKEQRLTAQENLREKRIAEEKEKQSQRLVPGAPPATLPFDENRHEFQVLIASSVGRELPRFGYSLFGDAPSTFAPVDRVPVTPDYVIGPGDEIVVRAWGQVDIDYRTVVDRNGAIHIPQIGSLTVGGLRYQDLHGFIRGAVAKVFRNFELNVMLGQLRSIQVFVVGQARFPGAYTVSSLSTLVNALFASGGPSTKGSMRRIQLKRGEQVVSEFDVYDLLLKGDKSKDVRLMSGDVLYIPPVGELVAISGSVNQPAIYELKGSTSLDDLIRLAGGLSTVAAGQKVTVERIIDRSARKIEEFSLDSVGLARNIQEGDLVQVFAVSPRFDNAVAIRGSVANAGRFPWREGMRVRDLIPDEQALIAPYYWEGLNRATGVMAADRQADGSRTARQRLGEAPISQGVEGPQRSGNVQSSIQRNEPGRLDMRRLFDEINWDYAVIERLNPGDLTTTIIPFNLGRALQGERAHNLQLRAGDIVTIFSRIDVPVPVAKQAQFVRLEGEVRTPGVYQLLPGETLRQLVTRIGGFTPSAYLYGSELTRDSVRVQQQMRLDEAIERLSLEVERGAAVRAQAAVSEDKGTIEAQVETQRRLIERLRGLQATGRIVLEVTPDRTDVADLPEVALQDGDRFFVPARPSTVAVIGSVYNQTAFVYDSTKNLADYLQMAGGLTRGADKSRTYVVRADGTVTGRAQGSLFSPFPSEKMNPGDTIVVPEDLERFFLTKQLRDWTQIFSQFALGVAALKVLRDF